MADKKFKDEDDDLKDQIAEHAVPFEVSGKAPNDTDPVVKGEDFSGETNEAAEPSPEQPAETDEEQLSRRVAELEDKLLRAAADFDNYRKRANRQCDEIARTANDRILLDLLPIMDNFERARQHASEDVTLESLLKGHELIHNQMVTLLTKYEIEPIEAVGKPFDPQLHDAMFQVESEEYPEGIVAQELNKGYKQGDRIIRHSKVAVSKGKAGKI